MNKRPCQPGEIYCLRCRLPKTPAGRMADCEAMTQVLGNLIGICPDCEAMMYRRVNLAKLERVRGDLEIRIRQAALRISEGASASVNRDLG